MINREVSAKLATVMSHEGTHYNGNRVEALAHLAGAETYAQLNQKFNLQADISFSMEMLSGIMNAESWKENTGDVDHWTLMANGDLVEDEDGWLRDENGNFIRDKDGNKIGANGIETGLLNILFGEKQSDGSMKNQGKNYTAFTDEQISIAQGLMYGAGFTNDGKGNLIGEGISNGGKISAACFVNSVESLTYIQNKLNEWGYPSYSYNIKGSVSTAFFRGH